MKINNNGDSFSLSIDEFGIDACFIIKETELSYQIRLPNQKKNFWIPKKSILEKVDFQFDAAVDQETMSASDAELLEHDGRVFRIVIPRWLAKERGLYKEVEVQERLMQAVWERNRQAAQNYKAEFNAASRAWCALEEDERQTIMEREDNKFMEVLNAAAKKIGPK